MRKNDRQSAEMKLRSYLSDLSEQRWDVSDFVRETHTLFDEPRKYWAFTCSKQTRQLKREAEEKTYSKTLHDAVLMQNNEAAPEPVAKSGALR
jgi:hypothetical protein